MVAQYDYIVVGAGSAGCVAARALSDNPDARVLLIEAGSPNTGHPMITTPAAWPGLIQSEFDWGAFTVPQVHANNRVIVYPRGKVLGGSSAINGMVHVPGHRADFDGWAAAGNEGWDYDSVLPLFKDLESHAKAPSPYHGSDGPLHVGYAVDPHPVTLALLEAGVQAGHARNDDPTGDNLLGIGLGPVAIKNGVRQSAAISHLLPVMDRPNLEVRTATQVLKLRFVADRCVGVEVLHNGVREVIEASGEIVLCAGALESPRLLMLSGIGRAEHLKKFDIDVRVDLMGVGENMQDHPLVAGVCYEMTDEAAAAGPPRNNLSECQLFCKSDTSLGTPDLQPVFPHVPYTMPEFGPPPAHAFTLLPGLVQPKARGNVKLQSADPDMPLAIDPNLLGHEDDVRALVRGVEICLEIGSQPALDGVRKREFLPGPELRSKPELEAFVRNAVSSYFHPVGTCKMGSDAHSVVGSDLRVHGIDGLRIADASIMPRITSANTNAPSMMIGAKVAQLIQEGRAVKSTSSDSARVTA
ncbi:MAG: GMC family oxidoreductase N-terminal domain-containing protein [Bacteroidota bacterium]